MRNNPLLPHHHHHYSNWEWICECMLPLMQLLGSSNRWHILVNLVSAIFEMADFLSSKSLLLLSTLTRFWETLSRRLLSGTTIPTERSFCLRTFSPMLSRMYGRNGCRVCRKGTSIFETDYFKNMKPINEAREVLTRLKEKV